MTQTMNTGDGDRAHLGRLVKLRREALGLSVRAAARRAGIDRDTWTAVEDGTRSTQDSKYAAIERVLDWLPGSIDQVLSGGDPILSGAAESERRERARKTIEGMTYLPEDTRQALLETLEEDAPPVPPSRQARRRAAG